LNYYFYIKRLLFQPVFADSYEKNCDYDENLFYRLINLNYYYSKIDHIKRLLFEPVFADSYKKNCDYDEDQDEDNDDSDRSRDEVFQT
jgi:hypothetical protein